MNETILTNIPFQPDLPALLAVLRVREGHRHRNDLEVLLHEAQAVARPKALYKVAFVDEQGDDWILLDGIRLHSRILRVNLDGTHRVFAYLASGGSELEQWSRSMDDLLHRFWADAIQEQALYAALNALQKHLDARFLPGPLSSMNPGSLEDWPLSEQHALFKILGDTKTSIGVHLTDSALMIPTKSVSGIFFPTDQSFASCQLCPRENCPNRRAPYDADLYLTKYAQN